MTRWTPEDVATLGCRTADPSGSVIKQHSSELVGKMYQVERQPLRGPSRKQIKPARDRVEFSRSLDVSVRSFENVQPPGSMSKQEVLMPATHFLEVFN